MHYNEGGDLMLRQKNIKKQWFDPERFALIVCLPVHIAEIDTSA